MAGAQVRESFENFTVKSSRIRNVIVKDRLMRSTRPMGSADYRYRGRRRTRNIWLGARSCEGRLGHLFLRSSVRPSVAWAHMSESSDRLKGLSSTNLIGTTVYAPRTTCIDSASLFVHQILVRFRAQSLICRSFQAHVDVEMYIRWQDMSAAQQEPKFVIWSSHWVQYLHRIPAVVLFCSPPYLRMRIYSIWLHVMHTTRYSSKARWIFSFIGCWIDTCFAEDAPCLSPSLTTPLDQIFLVFQGTDNDSVCGCFESIPVDSPLSRITAWFHVTNFFRLLGKFLVSPPLLNQTDCIYDTLLTRHARWT